MKSHYVYLAIGLDKRYLSWLYKFNIPILQMYIGVRTGILPDNSYKTSSRNKQWLYLYKHALAIFEAREQANEAEITLLRACISATSWALLANKAIGKLPNQAGRKQSAETKAKYKREGKQNPFYGKSHTTENRLKHSMLMTGRKQSNETIAKRMRYGECHHNYGKMGYNKDKELPKQSANLAIKRHLRLSQYGPIAIKHKEQGAILLADSQCMLDFCEHINLHLSYLEGLIKGLRKSTKGWSLI